MHKVRTTILVLLMVAVMSVPAFARGDERDNGGANSFSGAEAGAAAIQSGNSNEVSIIQNGAPIPRNFAIPGQWVYPAMPQEFQNDSKDGNFLPAKNLLLYGDIYSYGYAKKFLDKSWFKNVTVNAKCATGKVEPTDEDTVKVITVDQKADLSKYTRIGSITARVTDGEATSEEVFAAIITEALKMQGAKYVILVGEGYQKFVKTSGWGVALGYTEARISVDEKSSGVGTAGIGYSSGKAGRVANPWIQAFVIGNGAPPAKWTP
jgi:hypothetical protein